MLALTGHAFEWVHTDGNAGDTQTPAFFALNPIGKVPTLVLDDGTILTESNAIAPAIPRRCSGAPPGTRRSVDQVAPENIVWRATRMTARHWIKGAWVAHGDVDRRA